ncbi:MAG: hypothetical protein ACFB9M_12335 [Myxococcota bacterium]
MLFVFLIGCVALIGCHDRSGTEPPPGGWANHAPTRVERVVDRDEVQLLEVSQGQLRTWVRVPRVGAKPGDYILLGQGTARNDVEIPEIGERVAQLVDIAHARAVDHETAQRAAVERVPKGALSVGAVYAQLDARADQEVVVYGIVVKVSSAIGWAWVHLRDSTGDPSAASYDLTVQTKEPPIKGVRVAYRGVLRKDVDLGFGYHYDALVEAASFVE